MARVQDLGFSLLLGASAWAAGCANPTTTYPPTFPELETQRYPGPVRPPGPLDFDRMAVGTLPAGWRIGATHGVGALATWSLVADVTAPTPPNALALTASPDASGNTFNVCWTDGVRFENGTLEIAFRANRGEEDQGGGPIWRVQDENDYYVCRANPLESNFRLYYVKEGERKQLASTQVEIASGWHKIRVEHEGQHIVCTLDGGARLEATDDHLPKPGGVGLWTKADAETSFDDLRVEPRP